MDRERLLELAGVPLQEGSFDGMTGGEKNNPLVLKKNIAVVPFSHGFTNSFTVPLSDGKHQWFLHTDGKPHFGATADDKKSTGHFKTKDAAQKALAAFKKSGTVTEGMEITANDEIIEEGEIWNMVKGLVAITRIMKKAMKTSQAIAKNVKQGDPDRVKKILKAVEDVKQMVRDEVGALDIDDDLKQTTIDSFVDSVDENFDKVKKQYGITEAKKMVDPKKITYGSDEDRAFAKKMKPTLNGMRSMATQMVHWASQEDDEDRALKVMMGELHRLLSDKEAVR